MQQDLACPAAQCHPILTLPAPPSGPSAQDTKFSYLWNCRAWLDQATKVVIATGEPLGGAWLCSLCWLGGRGTVTAAYNCWTCVLCLMLFT